MTAPVSADSELELFREDLDAVKRDVASLIEDMIRRSDEHGSERRVPG